ncbi:MAG: tetratricopeptide repeat protein [Polyangiaceae bacterium]|nr:tetratricopeptide repeat protein [Polyangiaceae bacterium]
MSRPAAASALLALAALAMGCVGRTVTRSADGIVYEGRYISARAYEAYARGVIAEADGRLEEAIRAFRVASDLDDEGPEAPTRLGAVLCRRGDKDEAADAFEDAIDEDPTYAAAYRERARCALASEDPGLAIESAELASILDPDDVDAALLHVAGLERVGRYRDAARLVVARIVGGQRSASMGERLQVIAAKTRTAASRGSQTRSSPARAPSRGRSAPNRGRPAPTSTTRSRAATCPARESSRRERRRRKEKSPCARLRSAATSSRGSKRRWCSTPIRGTAPPPSRCSSPVSARASQTRSRGPRTRVSERRPCSLGCCSPR